MAVCQRVPKLSTVGSKEQGREKKKANRVFPPQRILIPRLIDARAAIVRG